MSDPLEIKTVNQEKNVKMLKSKDSKREIHVPGTDFKEILYQVKLDKKEKNKSLMKAIMAVKCGAMSQRQAAMKFGIPRSTIQDRMTNKRPADPGLLTVNRPPLTFEEERELMRWIQSMESSGFDVPHFSLVESALSIVKESPRSSSGERGAFSNWLHKFLIKWTEVKDLEKEIEASKETPHESIEHWFSRVENIVQLSGVRWLLDGSSNANQRVLYIEVASFEVDLAEPVEMSVVKDLRSSSQTCTTPSVTVLSSIDAGGERIPGLILYPLKTVIPKSIIKGHTSEFSIGKSDTGNLSTKIFSGYILNILLPHLTDNRKLPAILFVKRDIDKISRQLFKTAEKAGLTILGLYSIESIAKIQQDNFSWVFDSMQNSWTQVDESEKLNLKLFQFPSKLISILKHRLSKEQLVMGWRNSCVFPLDHDAIKIPNVKKEISLKVDKIHPENAFIAMSSLLSFLPRSKLENFEATLQGNAKLDKSDETVFSYFCHLKQALVNRRAATLCHLDSSTLLTASSGQIKAEPPGQIKIEPPEDIKVEPPEEINVEPDLMDKCNVVMVKMEQFEDSLFVENILS